mgnify:CR=1 FL=1
MPEPSWNSAAVRFIDREALLAELRRAAAAAKAARPEIVKVLLFGSFVRGDWTADSDADLIVVVRQEFADIFERSHYQIHVRSVPTDTLVCSETEFEEGLRDRTSFLGQTVPTALEL